MGKLDPSAALQRVPLSAPGQASGLARDAL